MSSVTCCPACSTLFKVVDDQLRVSKGWVRCGSCAEVFDAILSLQAVHVVAIPWAENGGESADTNTTPHALNPAVGPEQQQNCAAGDTAAADAATPTPVNGAVVLEPSVATPPQLTVLQQSNSSELNAQRQAVASTDFREVSFVQQANRQAFWRKAGIRAVLYALGLILLMMLALQAAGQHADRIAAGIPKAMPALQALCRAVGCVVGPLRRAEALKIDSATFIATGTHSFRLGFVLKNLADIPLQAPSLELTLTDHEDKALLRRVLSPAQFGVGGAALLGARSETIGGVNLTLAAAADANGVVPVAAALVAGYRVLVFYP